MIESGVFSLFTIIFIWIFISIPILIVLKKFSNREYIIFTGEIKSKYFDKRKSINVLKLYSKEENRFLKIFFAPYIELENMMTVAHLPKHSNSSRYVYGKVVDQGTLVKQK